MDGLTVHFIVLYVSDLNTCLRVTLYFHMRSDKKWAESFLLLILEKDKQFTCAHSSLMYPPGISREDPVLTIMTSYYNITSTNICTVG